MYHYVREYDAAYPYFRFLDVADFARQLDYFEQEYGFLSLEEWEARLAGQPGDDEKVVLTFDDAMSCHYRYVYPLLRQRGLWGIFYVPTLPYSDGRMVDVHKVHLLCGAIDGETLLREALERVTDEMVPFEKREEFHRLTYTRQVNLPGVSEFKRILNYFVDERFRTGLLADIAAAVDFAERSEDFYCTPDELREMADGGMIIGSHTRSHPVMSKLGPADQEREIRGSFDCLEAICQLRHKTYCHPYGGFHSFDQDTVRILDEVGVSYSFNVEPRDIEPGDIGAHRQYLPRYDCNRFPHGKAS
jgi:peptidoglycan/xylan/chitin deacetylase (PgdA/CDA1 family)